MSRWIRITVVALGIAMSAALSGCTPQAATTPASQTPTATVAASPDAQPDMVGTRFSSSARPPESGDDTRGVKYGYTIASGRGFTGYYLVDNVRPLPHTYAFLAFVDYQQVPVVLGGTPGLTHMLHLGPQEQSWWSLDVRPLSAGRHTLSTVLVWDPDNHSTDAAFRQASEWGMVSTTQANVLVGKRGAFPAPKLTKPSGAVSIPAGTEFDGVLVNQSSTSIEPWTSGVAAPAGSQVDYVIHVGNSTSKTARYALIALLDYVQVPIGSDARQPTIVSVPPGKCLNFTAHVTAPTEPGVHELMVVRADMPFVAIANESDTLMQGSARIPITVR